MGGLDRVFLSFGKQIGSAAKAHLSGCSYHGARRYAVVRQVHLSGCLYHLAGRYAVLRGCGA